MFVARASRALAAAPEAARRGLASVAGTSGIQFAAVDGGEPTTAITVLSKAGSRYAPKAGLAHVLKNFAFKNTASRSALRTVREAELHGGVLSSSLSREYLAITAEFLRGDEELFAGVLASVLSSTKYNAYELAEDVLPVVQAESLEATSSPTVHILELAHALAFRNGLGSSLYAESNTSVSVDEVKAFASTVFSKGNVVVVGSGISQQALSRLFDKHVKLSERAPAVNPTSYHGGEWRLPATDAHQGQTTFVGFGSTAPSPELQVLAAHLSTSPSVKWSKGLSPLAQAIPAHTTVQNILLPYSDASLFGFVVHGQSTSNVTQATKAAVQALKALVKTPPTAEELKSAVAKAKFSAALAAEGKHGLLYSLGPQLLSGSTSSLETTLAALDKVTASAVGKYVGTLLKSKPTYVSIGDTHELPYLDQLEL